MFQVAPTIAGLVIEFCRHIVPASLATFLGRGLLVLSPPADNVTPISASLTLFNRSQLFPEDTTVPVLTLCAQDYRTALAWWQDVPSPGESHCCLKLQKLDQLFDLLLPCLDQR